MSAEESLQGPALSLSEAVEVAQRENFKVNAVKEAVEGAEQGVRVSRSQYLPSLSVMTGISDYSGKVFISRFVNPADPTQPRPDGGETDVGPYNSTVAALARVSQTIYSGGAIGAKVSGSRVAHRIAQQEYLQMQVDLTYEVTKAYYDVLLSERAADVGRSAVLRTEENLETVNRRFSEGEALQVEVLGARSQLAADRQALLEAENSLLFARRVLNRLMAREPDSELRLAGSLERRDVDADEAESVRLALEKNPQARKARLEIELANSMVDGARAHFKPKVGLEAYVAYLDNEFLFKGTYYGANINLSIPFLQDFSAGGGALGEARARVRQQQNSLEEVNSLLSLLAQQSARRVQESRQAIQVAEEYLSYHRELYRVTQTSYAEQLATFSDLLDSHTELSEAELNLFQTLHRLQLAGAELERVTGSHDGGEAAR